VRLSFHRQSKKVQRDFDESLGFDLNVQVEEKIVEIVEIDVSRRGLSSMSTMFDDLPETRFSLCQTSMSTMSTAFFLYCTF
jgi:hypothetical protein